MPLKSTFDIGPLIRDNARSTNSQRDSTAAQGRTPVGQGPGNGALEKPSGGRGKSFGGQQPDGKLEDPSHDKPITRPERRPAPTSAAGGGGAGPAGANPMPIDSNNPPSPLQLPPGKCCNPCPCAGNLP